MILLLVGVHGALVIYGRRAGMPVWPVVALGLVVVGTCLVEARLRRRARQRSAPTADGVQPLGQLRDAA